MHHTITPRPSIITPLHPTTITHHPTAAKPRSARICHRCGSRRCRTNLPAYLPTWRHLRRRPQTYGRHIPPATPTTLPTICTWHQPPARMPSHHQGWSTHALVRSSSHHPVSPPLWPHHPLRVCWQHKPPFSKKTPDILGPLKQTCALSGSGGAWTHGGRAHPGDRARRPWGGHS